MSKLAPLLLTVIAVSILVISLVLLARGKRYKQYVRKLSQSFFAKSPDAEVRSANLLSTLGGFLFALGGVLLVLGILFLQG